MLVSHLGNLGWVVMYWPVLWVVCPALYSEMVIWVHSISSLPVQGYLLLGAFWAEFVGTQ